MKSALIIILICYAQIVHGQKEGNILYILPDSVEIYINNYLQSSNNNKSKYYSVLQNISKDTFEIDIVLFQDGKKSVVNNWVLNSNRYILVNKREIPLLLDNDFAFGLSNRNKIGTFGQRDEVTSRIRPLYHHYYYVKFLAKNGIVLENSQKW